ncbi:hypothetical protein N9F33_03435, partial [Pseudomonadales bacterium]|nr:hypothetical protein [Pseudomonadales bacterium]
MVIFIADLPTPVHGASNVSQAFLKLMSSVDSTLAIKVIDTAPSLVSRFYPGKIWKLIKLFWMIASIVRLAIFLSLNVRKVTCLIHPINAGFGQLYDLLITIVAKIFCVKIYFHHHSFKYLNKKSKLSWVLFKVAGGSTIHIALGQKMKVKLKETYSLNSNIEVLSNAFMFDPIKSFSGIHKSKDGPFVLGHLANVCVEKGVFEFLDTLKILNELGFKVIGKLAGPIH